MKVKKMVVVWLILFSLNSIGCADRSNDQTGSNNKKVGEALLDNVVSRLSQPGISGNEKREDIKSHLSHLWGEAKKARDKGQIDQIYYTRYKRILVVIMLNVITDEKNIIINSLIFEEINKFDIPAIDDTQNLAGIGSIAKTLSEEIASLKKYLKKKSK